MLEKIQRFLQSLQAGQKLDLSFIISQAEPDAPLMDRVNWLRSLLEWIRHEGESISSVSTRLKFALQLLDRYPEWKTKTALTIRSILRESDTTRLFSEVGLPTQPTFLREFFGRLGKILIPHFDDPHKASHLQFYLFYDPDDSRAFREIPPDLFDGLLTWIRTGLPDDEPLLPELENQMLNSCQILLNRSITIALREVVSDRAPEFPVVGHPLLEAQRLLWEMTGRMNEEHLPSSLFDQILHCLQEGQNLTLAVQKHLESTGVTVDLVYQLDRMSQDLTRLQRLLFFLRARKSDPKDFPRAFSMLWNDLFRGLQFDQDAGFVLKQHLSILARKVVERTGFVGEHYVVQNWPQFKLMLFGGLGGGAVTSLTTVIKYAVDTKGWPIFPEFIYSSLNYSVSFVVMHFLGFKLATKQPSLTASHLAARLREDEGRKEDEAFVDEVARISRSQFGAFAGNLLGVIPCILIFGWIFQYMTGNAFLSPAKAKDVLGSLHPFFSGAVFYAAMTGFLLWFASMISGWAENASAFYQIPKLLTSHPLLRWWLGKERAEKLGFSYQYHVAGVVAAVALGILLGLLPLVGKFFGLPLDIRHVTLSTGIATAAFQTLGFDAVMFWMTAVGVLSIGFLNFTVSFYISLLIALRAREVPSNRLAGLARHVLQRFWKSPRDFFIPPRING